MSKQRPVICIQEREDGGLRVWSDELPGLILSGRDPARVMADIFPAARALIKSNEEWRRIRDRLLKEGGDR